MAQFYAWLGAHKSGKIKLAVMDMWKSFSNVAKDKAPQAAILFDKFRIMRHLGRRSTRYGLAGLNRVANSTFRAAAILARELRLGSRAPRSSLQRYDLSILAPRASSTCDRPRSKGGAE
jgi:transposase